MAPPSRCSLRRWRQIGWAQGLSERYVLGVGSDAMSVLPSRSLSDRIAVRRWRRLAWLPAHELPSVLVTVVLAWEARQILLRASRTAGAPAPEWAAQGHH